MGITTYNEDAGLVSSIHCKVVMSGHSSLEVALPLDKHAGTGYTKYSD